MPRSAYGGDAGASRRGRLTEAVRAPSASTILTRVPTVSFLFVDQVGSTAQLQVLGDERAAPVRRALFDIIQSALAAHGGTLVDNTGDGVMATFGSAVAAVDCAAAIQGGVRRHNRTRPAAESVEVRAGIHTGEPVTDEAGRYFGMAVVVAARLCAAAEGGQILVSDLVRALCASRDHLVFSSIGSLELKGVGEPVPAHIVVMDLSERSALIPAPEQLTVHEPFFVGRVAARAAIDSAWRAVEGGDRRLVLVSGDPGVGKTRLVAEAAVAAHERGAIVLFGRCDDELGIPYQPFVEGLRHVVRYTPAPRLATRLGRYGGELGRLLPELAGRADLPARIASDAETERYRLFDAVTSWLVALAAEAPVLFVIDDLHWATKPTLLLLRYLAQCSELSHVCVVTTYRQTDLGREHPLTELLADLRREAGVARLALPGLTEHDIAELIAKTAQQDHDLDGDHLARIIHAETDGNAFFVAEVLRYLMESGEVVGRNDRRAPDRPPGELSIPESVREVVGRRLGRLGPQVNQVLEVAAVAGLQLDVAVLAAAHDVAPDELLVTLDDAATAGLVRYGSVACHRFAHALVRTTVYDGLPLARRVRLHRRVAEAIERVHSHRLDEHLSELAYHFAQATVGGDVSTAVDYSTRAGDRALAQLAHDEAASYYRQALDLLDAAEAPADSRRAGLLVALAEAQARAGDRAHRQTIRDAVELARALGDSDRLVDAALVRSRIDFGIVEVEGVDDERVELLEEALATAPERDTRTRARLLATLAGDLGPRDATRAERLSADAVAMARRLGDPAVLAYALHARFYGLEDPETRGERRAVLTEQAELARRLGDPLHLFWANINAFTVALEELDPEAIADHLVESERLAAELNQPALRWLVGTGRVTWDTLTGNFEAAERLMTERLAAGQAIEQSDAFYVYATQLFTLRLLQGRAGELADLATSVTASWSGIPGILEPIIALLQVESGRADEARATLEPLAAGGFTELAHGAARLVALAAAAWVAATLGERVWAQCLESLLRPHLGLGVEVGWAWWGPVDRYVALLNVTLDRLDEADQHFAAAAELSNRMGATPWLARTQIEWADMLERRGLVGDKDKAATLRTEALATAKRLGLTAIEQRASN